ncbi:hypothetical protein NP233_g9899 [Leucocoprinus birnbaumii]|uniref:Uncharacterized protein n=1 Tax=Leucocoprinus birnbaumii TaxID=56174 RepID=A0AAD5VKA0_9AGAR|nr:hypothetical protein NP233_g9899 [Leucocoprinus birnbaumii]
MASLAAPPYIFLSFLDKYFPHKHLVDDTSSSQNLLFNLIKEKRINPGNAPTSLMLAEPTSSEQVGLDNISLFFVAEHASSLPGPTVKRLELNPRAGNYRWCHFVN